jgi:hypothetical protein
MYIRILRLKEIDKGLYIYVLTYEVFTNLDTDVNLHLISNYHL